ncbi:hypothetical protein N7U66_00320 [Lacinutrix neustonica]|uniref:Uncharacterized protein n=1 Tax=Lacinutrix neustonica TaxID=2980107 RepID=A0A9E8MXV3_9FLAO|nr:hypothetical protein [Lacinutrix neustonica]WAC02265.1 hypothetical protein N7U66_00320 [Lacinutrix neustonica]
MIDPTGQYFDDARGKHHYIKPILGVGIEHTIKALDYNLFKF